MFRRILLRSLALAPALFVLLAGAQIHAQTGAAASWHVTAGAGTPDSAIATLKFYPSTMTVDAGDTVSWTFVADAHTVTFLSGATAPSPLDPSNESSVGGGTYNGTGVASSGIVLPIPGMHYDLTFTQAGTYQYVCTIHPGMAGSVVVQAAGAAYPQTQTQIDATTRSQGQQDVAAMQALVQAFKPATTTNASGASTLTASMGLGNGSASSLRFLPTDISVNAGDTVMWANDDPVEPHTVTFAGSNGQFPEFPTDPQASAPVGGSTYDGAALTSSGIVAPKGIPGNAPYSLTFTRPGQYRYICTIHAELGMVGSVTVRPAVPSGAPNTGVGPGPQRQEP